MDSKILLFIIMAVPAILGWILGWSSGYISGFDKFMRMYKKDNPLK